MWAGGSTGSSNRLNKFSVRRTELEPRSRAWPREPRARPIAAGSGCAPVDAAVLKSDGDCFRTAGPRGILKKNLVCHLFIKGKLITPTRFGRQAALWQHVDAVMVRNALLPKYRCPVVRYQTWDFWVDVNQQQEAETSLPGVPR